MQKREVDAGAFEVQQADVMRLQPEANCFDVIFCDPPYALIVGNEKAMFDLAARALKAEGLFMWEHPAEVPLPASAGFTMIKSLGGKGLRTPNVGVFRRAELTP